MTSHDQKLAAVREAVTPEQEYIEEKVGAEYAFLPEERKECLDFLDHTPQWCGDCYACARCGLVFVSKKTLRTALTEVSQKAEARGKDQGVEEERARILEALDEAMDKGCWV